MERVNRIVIDNNAGSPIKIRLMRTHTVLATILPGHIGVPNYEPSMKGGKAKYIEYLRERMTRLLKDNKVEGFYWDESPQSDTGITKFTIVSLGMASATLLTEIIGKYGFTCEISDVRSNSIKDAYKDGSICNGAVTRTVLINGAKHPSSIQEIELQDNPLKIQVAVEVKSGQLCKPKVFSEGGHDGYSFTMFGIHKAIERRDNHNGKKEAT